MRITAALREQIVDAVMVDVPNIDSRHIKSLYETMDKRAREVALAQLPEKVRAIYKDPELRDYTNTNYVYICCVGYRLPGLEVTHYSTENPLRTAIEEDPAFKEAHEAYDKARETAKTLRATLITNLSLCKTVKAFVELFPELSKYAPQEDKPVAQLPATTALMDSLKAAGLKVEEASESEEKNGQ